MLDALQFLSECGNVFFLYWDGINSRCTYSYPLVTYTGGRQMTFPRGDMDSIADISKTSYVGTSIRDDQEFKPLGIIVVISFV